MTANLTAINSALKPKANTDKNDRTLKLFSVKEKRNGSPLENIGAIKTNITMTDILEAIKQGRTNKNY
jgi:hypothetical protein